MRYLSLAGMLLLAAVSLPVLPVSVALHAQQSPPLLNSPLTHIVVVTPDLAKLSRGYADLFGISVPESKEISYDLPDGKTAVVKAAYVPMPNFYVELLEPITKAGPVYQHVQTFGQGIYALGVRVNGNIDDVRDGLVAMGGKWTGGKKGGDVALVDFRNSPIGATIEIGSSARPAMPPAPAVHAGLTGGLTFRHVGFANEDLQASIKWFKDAWGVPIDAPKRYPSEGGFPAPPENHWNPTAHVNYAFVKPPGGDAQIELIQAFGDPNHYSAHIKQQKGTSAMHICFDHTKIPRQDWVRIAQEKGGKWILGAPTEGVTYFQWPELSVVIE